MIARQFAAAKVAQTNDCRSARVERELLAEENW